jgi:hypothetical protein
VSRLHAQLGLFGKESSQILHRHAQQLRKECQQAHIAWADRVKEARPWQRRMRALSVESGRKERRVKPYVLSFGYALKGLVLSDEHNVPVLGDVDEGQLEGRPHHRWDVHRSALRRLVIGKGRERLWSCMTRTNIRQSLDLVVDPRMRGWRVEHVRCCISCRAELASGDVFFISFSRMMSSGWILTIHSRRSLLSCVW